MGRHPAAALKQVVQAVTHRDPVGVTDRELLRRFVTVRDQEAFAALVRRHSGLVLGVCRRALPTVQDAEDACQAVFLVLARKAATGRWQTSIANWLYTTARKVAHNARVTAQRRAKREARAAVPEQVAALDLMTGRELLSALDEELARLPIIYREALVLCYLEGLTCEQAAGRLGVPRATLKIRLERGRKKLGDALTRRGLVLGAGLLALAATSPAGASPPRLTDAILAAATGQASPTVAALANEVTVNGILSKATLLLLLLGAASAWGFGTAGPGPTAAGQPPDKAMPAPVTPRGKPAASAPELTAERAMTGKVLAPDGKPVAGAALVLLSKAQPPERLGTTAADGSYTVKVPLRGEGAFLIAQAAGFGIDLMSPRATSPAEVIFHLVPDQPIRGRVIDTQGKPVAGVTITPNHLSLYSRGTVDPFLEAWKTRHFMSGFPNSNEAAWFDDDLQFSSPAGQRLLAAVTDADGRFAIPGVGAERVIRLRLRGPGIAESELTVVTRAGFDPGPYNQAAAANVPKGQEGFGSRWLLVGPDLVTVAEAEKPVQGTVTDIATGKPRAGVLVTLSRAGGDLLPIPLSARTDAEGRYAIRGARKAAKGYMVEVAHDPDSACLPCQVHVADSPGYAPVTIDLRVKKGVVVAGRIIDGGTGKPIQGFAMAAVLSDNPYLKDYPRFDQSAWVGMTVTKADGAFRVITIPGPVLLMGGSDALRGPDGGMGRFLFKPPMADPKYPKYFDARTGFTAFYGPGGVYSPLQGSFAKVLEIAPGTERVEQDIVLERAATLPVKLVDADGKPVAGTVVGGVSPEEWHDPLKVTGDTVTLFHVVGPRLVVAFDPKQKLCGSLALKGGEKEAVVLRLGPPAAVTGRVLDEDGKPLAGVTVALNYRDRAAQEVYNRTTRQGKPVVTDAEGRFQLPEVLPGLRFGLSYGIGRKTYETTGKPTVWTADAGSVTTVGDRKVRPKPEAEGG